MTPDQVSERIVADRVALARELVRRIRDLPLGDLQSFTSDPRSVAAAESYLRRSLEAVLDVGRHILAKGFGQGVSEYKEIARELRAHGVLSSADAATLETLAGYRNRLVHFYHQISDEELYSICRSQLGDIERPLAAIMEWMKAHPTMVDRTL